MGRNLLSHASLGLYNHFDTHEAEYHVITVVIRILPYRYVCARVSNIMFLCTCVVCIVQNVDWVIHEALVKSLYPP